MVLMIHEREKNLNTTDAHRQQHCKHLFTIFLFITTSNRMFLVYTENCRHFVNVPWTVGKHVKKKTEKRERVEEKKQ